MSNTRREQSSRPVIDLHVHICPDCLAAWSHHKSRIAPGESFLAHVCPVCGSIACQALLPVPFHEHVDSIQYLEYYGAGSHPLPEKR